MMQPSLVSANSDCQRQQLRIIADRRKSGDALLRLAAIRILDRQLIADAIVGGSPEDPLAVIHKQGAGRIERQPLGQRLPAVLALLRPAQLVGTHHQIQMVGKTELRILHRQTGGVSVGEKHQLLARGAQLGQKRDGMGTPLDLRQQLLLEGANIEPQGLAPVIHAVPVEGAVDGVIVDVDLRFGFIQRQTEPLGVTLRHQLLPEVVVKMEIDQGAIHIEQDSVYLVPGQWGRHGASVVGSERAGIITDFSSRFPTLAPWCSRGESFTLETRFFNEQPAPMSDLHQRKPVHLSVDTMAHDKSKPEILKAEIVAESRLFRVESLHLKFSNGEERVYERMRGGNRGAVMVVPLFDAHTLLLVREYAAGTHSYELGFPKGLIDPGEDAFEAGNRELMEEAGFGANSLTLLKQVSLAPGYFSSRMDILLARDLFPEQRIGDEPEPLEVIPWPLNRIDELLARPDFTESRSISALLLAQKWLAEQAK